MWYRGSCVPVLSGHSLGICSMLWGRAAPTDMEIAGHSCKLLQEKDLQESEGAMGSAEFSPISSRKQTCGKDVQMFKEV